MKNRKYNLSLGQIFKCNKMCMFITWNSWNSNNIFIVQIMMLNVGGGNDNRRHSREVVVDVLLRIPDVLSSATLLYQNFGIWPSSALFNKLLINQFM